MKLFHESARLALASSLVVSLVIISITTHDNSSSVEALPTLSCAKNYLVSLIRQRVINRSNLIQTINQATANVDKLFEQAKANGALANMDQYEQSNYYYKLLIDEMRTIRLRYESMNNKKQTQISGSNDGDSIQEPALNREDHMISACLAVSNDVDQNHQTAGDDDEQTPWDPEAIIEEESENEIRLRNELKSLEDMVDSDTVMGWSMSPETILNIKKRTNSVVRDLLSNELRQLALAILTAWVNGGTLVGVLGAVSGGLQYKIAEFLLNMLIDVVSGVLGRRIEIKDPSHLKHPLADILEHPLVSEQPEQNQVAKVEA